MSDEQPPPKRPRGRPRKIKPEEPRPTTTIQEGASWHVGVPMPELEQKATGALKAIQPEDAVKRALEIMNDTSSVPAIQPNSVVQIRTEARFGQLALIGEVESDQVHCYAFSSDGGREFFTVKIDEIFLISGPKKGLRVIRYEKQESAPDWHEKPQL